MCLFAFNVSEVVDTFSWTLHVWTRVTVKLQITMLPNLVAGQDQSSPWMMQKPLHVKVLQDHIHLKDHKFAIMPSTVFPFLIFCYMEYFSFLVVDEVVLTTYILELILLEMGLVLIYALFWFPPTPLSCPKKNNGCKCSLCVCMSSTYNIWLLMFL